MSATTKYAITLGSDFTCKSDDTENEKVCPMFTNIGPQTDTYTGIITCPQCGIELGTEPSMGDELYDDDPDDEDIESIEEGFVSEGEKRIDFATPEERREVGLKRSIQKFLGPIGAHNSKIAIAIDEATNEIIQMLYRFEEAKIPEFTIRDNRAPLLAIALHLTSREIPENVYKQLRIKSARVLYLRNIIRTLDSPHEDNNLESTFTFIGRSADVPDTIVQRAYSAYLEENPYNSIDSESVRVAAWIYLFCQRIKFKVTKKAFYSNISGVSRISFGRAVDSYQDQRQNSHIAK